MEQYYLGDGVNYFQYRSDRYDHSKFRVTLFNKYGDIIDDVSTNGKSHHDIINYFEARVQMKLVPNEANESHYRRLKSDGLMPLPKDFVYEVV